VDSVRRVLYRALRAYTQAWGVEPNLLKPFGVRVDAPMLTVKTVNRRRYDE